MEEIAGEQDHVDVVFSSEAHDFVEGFPAIVATDRITFVVADMAVCCYQDADCIGG